MQNDFRYCEKCKRPNAIHTAWWPFYWTAIKDKIVCYGGPDCVSNVSVITFSSTNTTKLRGYSAKTIILDEAN